MARRNDPCSCGSGMKYKLCHGRTSSTSGLTAMGASKAQLFRQVTPDGAFTFYHVQVWKPTLEDGDILRSAGFKPHDGGNEDLKNTMVFYTIDPEAALKIATPEQWEAAPSWELGPAEVIEEEDT